jgi:transcriptional regulator with XRE-family HTH domain
MVRDSVSLTTREFKRDLLVMIKTQPEGVVFGQRLRELRIARDLSQRALADLCGSHKPFISELERGVKVPSLTMILRLAEALDCGVYDLVEVFERKGGSRKQSKR